MNPSSVSSEIDVEYFKEKTLKYCPVIYDEINKMQPMPAPLRPVELIEFDNFPKTKKYESKEKFFKQDFIKDYLGKKWQSELHNRDCFLRLYEIYHTNEWCFETIKEAEKHAVLQKLRLFYDKIKHQDTIYPALRLNFKEFKFDKYETQQQATWEE